MDYTKGVRSKMSKTKSSELERQATLKHDKGFNERLVVYRAKTIRELCKGPKVLELGCGDGLITQELVSYFDDVMAVDASTARVRRAVRRVRAVKDKKAKVTFHVAMFEDFEPQGSFDTIIASNILEHVDTPTQVLRKAKTWLKEGGYIIIVVPNAYSIHRRIGRIMGLLSDVHELTEENIADGHKRTYSTDMLRKDITRSGLRIESIGGVLLKPLSNTQMRELSPEVTDAFYEVGKQLPADYCAEVWARCILLEDGLNSQGGVPQ